METEVPKRNYIRRKKCLNESAKTIAITLKSIYQQGGKVLADSEIMKEAQQHALRIEAACWIPRAKISAEDYKRQMKAKTIELCNALGQNRLQRAMSTHKTPDIMFVGVTPGKIASSHSAPMTPVLFKEEKVSYSGKEQSKLMFSSESTNLSVMDSDSGFDLDAKSLDNYCVFE